jgi:hypothetical protein
MFRVFEGSVVYVSKSGVKDMEIPCRAPQDDRRGMFGGDQVWIPVVG